jgi:Mg-chelatase subunit ChlD
MFQITLKISVLSIIFASIVFSQTVDVTDTNPNTKPEVSYGFVVDNSGSLRTRFERVVQTVSRIIESNEPSDEAFLITFIDSEKIVIRQELTRDKALLLDAAENMFIEGGRTSIIDAVSVSADYLAENTADPNRLKRLILVTDGDEFSSRTKIADLLSKLKEKKIKVLVFGISDQKIDPKLIDRLIKESGGRKYFPKTQAETDEAVKAIIADLRSEL